MLRMMCTTVVALMVVAAPTAQRAGKNQRHPASTTAPQTQVAQSVALEQQVRLDRAGFSPGEIDGKGGTNTTRAQAAYDKAGMGASHAGPGGNASPQGDAALIAYTITPEDVAGPFTESIPPDLMQQAALPALNYTSALEAIGEKFHSSPALLQQLNPAAKFVAGESIKVPNVVQRADLSAVAEPQTGARGATKPAATPAPPNIRIVVSKTNSSLTVLDEKGAVMFYAPVTSGSQHDPLPLGKWTVTAVSRHPTFMYNPDLFWDANPSHSKAKIPAGPNNPVGLVWIDISKEHYGIHGTPEPSKIGHTQSHGCVRLTNWDAVYVAGLVKKGTPVLFER